MNSFRLFEILYYLLEHKETTAQCLSEHFEVSIRTIYRDLDRLLMIGIPIHLKQGKQGGIFLDETFVLEQSLLSNQQKDNLLLALQMFSTLEIQEFQSLYQQMQSFFQRDNVEWLDIDWTSWGSQKDMGDKFKIIQKAVIENNVIEFRYIDMKGKVSNKKIQPYQLVYKGYTWYLRGFDIYKEALRIYKLTRMSHICIHKDRFVKRKLDFSFCEYKESGEEIEVVLWFENDLGHFVYDAFSYEDITSDEKGYIVHTKVIKNKYLFSFLLSFGSGMKIIEPILFKEEFLNEVRKILENYEES
ncbi:MAG: YafY family transcriptional regulator [Erysipelotrichales bacterium]|nr:YafY family transcriptional regulator [Erysipelotrichales bacterium]